METEDDFKCYYEEVGYGGLVKVYFQDPNLYEDSYFFTTIERAQYSVDRINNKRKKKKQNEIQSN